MSERILISQQRILQECFDATNQALQVVLKNLEISLALSHEENDSVFAVRRNLAVPANTTVSCAGYQYFCAFESGTLLLSPKDEGDTFYTITYTPGQPLLICARRLRCSVDCVIQG